MKKMFIIVASFIYLGLTSLTQAAPLNISSIPLSLTNAVPPLTMIVLGRDHKLYYEAYNDASDLNADGQIDVGYQPTIDYYGYFDSYKCYTYSNSRFEPTSVTTNKQCNGQWSGDFLNYLTTSRIDALRKVLYGGFRSTDDADLTILERTNIPQDAHSWGKEYTSLAVDGYNISDYTPYALPTNGRRHLFANTTLVSGNGEPLLRVLLNQPYRIWEWLSIERPVAGNRVIHGGSGPYVGNQINNFVVRVHVCKTTNTQPTELLENNCQNYPQGTPKPVGLLQDFGENGAMKFGLLTGSYSKNLSGGVVRKNVENFSNEINPQNGTFSQQVGIVKTIDRLKIIGFNSSYVHNSNCGFIFRRDMLEGECRLWGNPISEMMYEATRYFSGKASPTPAFTYSGGDDDALGLPKPNWIDPYDANENPYCASPNMLVISDINPSYDSDQLPGSHFSTSPGQGGAITNDLSPAMNVKSLGQTIWNQEAGGSRLHFIGESGANNDGSPSPKTVTSFGNIRGLSPEEPNKQGSYYAGSVAYYGWLNDLHTAKETQKLNTFAVALASPLPKITIPVNGQTISLIPFGKSVGPQSGCIGGIDKDQGDFQPTNTIVDFYVEQITPTYGKFRINFEDAQQGADHDMDAIANYEYQVNPNNTVTVTLTSTYAAGCVIQHMGYIISGTTKDGTYLEIRDSDTSAGNDVDYFLDTPPGQDPGGNWQDNKELPLIASRTFIPSNNAAATLLQNPLWFAAKWGSFTDQNNNQIPDLSTEYDTDNNNIPDNYFLVTNALKLKDQLTAVLSKILKQSNSSSAATFNSGYLNSNAKIYQSLFSTADWSGQLLAFELDPSTGQIVANSGPSGSLWDSGALLKNQQWDFGRHIITYNPNNNLGNRGVGFRWNTLTNQQKQFLNKNSENLTDDGLGEKRLEYLRGSHDDEQNQGGTFRVRNYVLGDLINSAPLFVGGPSYFYNEDNYGTFKATYHNRRQMIYAGANDGMLHAFDSETGKEVFAYVPNALIKNLNSLTSPRYTHDYFVDGSVNVGDVYYGGKWHTLLIGGLNAGGRGIYALDITDPNQFRESDARQLARFEFTDEDDKDLGYTFSQPAIVKLANGKWGAVFGNGYNNTTGSNASTTGNAVLYIVDIENGNIIKKLDTKEGMNDDPLGQGRPNGLATPLVVDSNSDHIADYVYAGDLFGNLWKFDIRDKKPSKWKVAFGNKPLFTAQYNSSDITTRQPITTRPNVTKIKGVDGGLQLFFGTGKYFEIGDKTDTRTQSFYSIRDNHKDRVTGRSQLLKQSIIDEISININNQTQDVRITSEYSLGNNDKGWYMDFDYGNNNKGERQVTESIVRNNKIIFSTLIPSLDPCGTGGSGWLMELNANDGGRLANPIFDLNDDKMFDSSDLARITQNGQNTDVVVSGLKSTVGLLSKPGIIDAGQVEYKYLSGSSGQLQTVTENPGGIATGRQSWRQLQ